jgi:hypothetical protein
MDNTICLEEVPRDIDCEALNILRQGSFVWDSKVLAFRRGAATIEYAFLREQKLVANGTMSSQERVGQLQRLRILLQSLD